MAAPVRSKFQIEKDREQISIWYLQGWTQARIAEEIGLSRTQITYDLRAIQKQWIKNTTFALDEYKGKELAKIDHVEAEAWLAWEKSKEQFKQQHIVAKGIKKIIDDDGNQKDQAVTVDKSTQIEDQYGNPRYLDLVMTCIERRCKMLGIDAPQKHEVTGKNGSPIEFSKVADLKDLSLEELEIIKQAGLKITNTIQEKDE